MRIFIALIVIAFALVSCSKKSGSDAKTADGPTKAKVVFVELGSTNCVPCRQMQDVMKKIEAKYADQIEVRFIDVNKDRSKANEYKIQLIPTQVFLDSAGVEFHRHEGFYPEEEIDKLLADKGLKQIGGTAN